MIAIAISYFSLLFPTHLLLFLFVIAKVVTLNFFVSFLTDRAERHVKITIFAIHSPFLLPSFFRREEKRGKMTKVVTLIHAFLLDLSHSFGLTNIISPTVFDVLIVCSFILLFITGLTLTVYPENLDAYIYSSIKKFLKYTHIVK